MSDAGWLFFLVAIPAAMLVGFSKGGLPVVGMLGVPVLSLATSPVRAAALLLPIYVVTDMFGLWAYRRKFDRRNLAILIPAATVGIGIGWATAFIVSERLVTLIVGVIGLSFCLNYWLASRRNNAPRPADLPRGLFWGTVSGFTSFVSHAGAPPYQMYVIPQRLEKMVYAGTTTILFAAVNAVKLVPYWALAAWLLPGAIAATFAGVWLVRIIPQALFYRMVVIALFLVSVKLVADAAMAS
jgi:uncharacterized membrane protein YfcA